MALSFWYEDEKEEGILEGSQTSHLGACLLGRQERQRRVGR